MNVLVTGAAGFIGSHLAEGLVAKGHTVSILDNLSGGRREFVPSAARFIQNDLVRDDFDDALEGIDSVFHFAANPNVRQSLDQTQVVFENNVLATYRVLEACRRQDVSRMVFASTSTVYGETPTMPTPEDHPCFPISNYGASKLAGEAYCSCFAASYGIKSTVLRFANIFGERSSHGIMYDFYHKLKKDPNRLEILGNGRQAKSYLHVQDAVAAVLLAWEKQRAVFDVFNAGSSSTVTVNEIAKKLCAALSLRPAFSYTGGDRGWAGDVPAMLLATEKLQKLDWKPTISFDDGLKRYVEWLRSSAL